jgi:hypothetical protein
VMSASRLTTPSGSSRIIAGHMTYRTLKGHAMTGQNETPEDIADDTEGHSAKAFSLGDDLEGYSAGARFGIDDVEGHGASGRFGIDDVEGHGASGRFGIDDVEGHGVSGRLSTEDVEGHNAKVFKGDDADDDTPDDDAEGHSLKIGLAGSMATPGLGTDAARLAGESGGGPLAGPSPLLPCPPRPRPPG